MYKNRSQGFTLIELLVVIAIIGILSAVVLASLNTARTKGSDAAIQSDLSAVQVQAEIFYGTNNRNKYNTDGTTGLAAGTCPVTGNTLFGDPVIANAINGAVTANGGAIATVTKCAVKNDGTSYAIAFQSKVTPANWYCVDSTGNTTATTKTATGGAAADAICN